MADYRGLNPRFGLNNEPIVVTGITAIKFALMNLILTRIGERLFLPTFGSRVPELLWESVSDTTANKILNEISIAIDEWEPRVVMDVTKSTVIANVSEHSYQISIAFYEVATDTPSTVTFTVFAEAA